MSFVSARGTCFGSVGYAGEDSVHLNSRALSSPSLDQYIEAVVAALNTSTWRGQRDHIMLTTLYNTGACVSELLEMRGSDLVFGPTSWVVSTARAARNARFHFGPTVPKSLDVGCGSIRMIFTSRCFPVELETHSRVGFTERFKLAVHTASRQFSELAKHRIFPRVIRHSVAMHMLESGVDITVIVLWLGHESHVTMHRYVEADYSSYGVFRR